MISYLGLTILKNGVFIVNIIFLMFYVFYNMFDNLNRQLENAIYQRNKQQISILKFEKIIKQFYVEHTRLIYLLLYSNESFWSKLIGLAFVSNMPINVYFVVYILTYLQISENMFLIAVILWGQLSVIFTTIYPILKSCKYLHDCTKYHNCIQQLLPLTTLSTKLKLLNHYQEIHSENKISLNVGPFGTITHMSLLQVNNRKKI